MSELTALEIADKRWTSFVQASPEAVPFHRPEWAQLLADCYGYRAFTFSRVDAVGRISCGLPILEVKSPLRGRQWVSLPFTDYCPPLAESEEEIGWLIEQVDAERRARGISQLEVRAPLPKKKNVHQHSTAVTHTLPGPVTRSTGATPASPVPAAEPPAQPYKNIATAWAPPTA